MRLWKRELQRFANEADLKITVTHLPPGTSKWNKIEHRLFAFITMNWRGKPLVSHQVIVQLIGSTSTETGLKSTSRATISTASGTIPSRLTNNLPDAVISRRALSRSANTRMWVMSNTAQ